MEVVLVPVAVIALLLWLASQQPQSEAWTPAPVLAPAPPRPAPPPKPAPLKVDWHTLLSPGYGPDVQGPYTASVGQVVSIELPPGARWAPGGTAPLSGEAPVVFKVTAPVLFDQNWFAPSGSLERTRLQWVIGTLPVA